MTTYDFSTEVVSDTESPAVIASATNAPASARIPVWSWRDAIAKANVPPLTKLVCYDISRYLSDAGKGWCVAAKDIQRDTGLSNKSVSSHLAKAVKAGLLVVKREHGPSGQRGITRYIPRFPDGVQLAREPADMAEDPRVPDTSRPALPSVPRTPRPVSPREPRTPSHVNLVHPSLSKRSLQEKDIQRESALTRGAPAKGQMLKGLGRPARCKPIMAPLPADAVLSDEGMAYARRKGLSEDRARSEWEAYGDYHRQHGSMMADWSAAWRMWVRHALRYDADRVARAAREERMTDARIRAVPTRQVYL